MSWTVVKLIASFISGAIGTFVILSWIRWHRSPYIIVYSKVRHQGMTVHGGGRPSRQIGQDTYTIKPFKKRCGFIKYLLNDVILHAHSKAPKKLS